MHDTGSGSSPGDIHRPFRPGEQDASPGSSATGEEAAGAYDSAVEAGGVVPPFIPGREPLPYTQRENDNPPDVIVDQVAGLASHAAELPSITDFLYEDPEPDALAESGYGPLTGEQEIPGDDAGQVPAYGSPPPLTPAHGTQQPTPAYGSPQTPARGSQQQTPGYGTQQQTPAYGSPQQTPAYGSPQQTPAYGSPQQTPAYGSPQQTPAYGTQQATPAYGSPQQTPAKGTGSLTPTRSTPVPPLPGFTPSRATPAWGMPAGDPRMTPAPGSRGLEPGPPPQPPPGQPAVPPGSEPWATGEWQRYDWRAAAALGAEERARAAEAWADLDWEGEARSRAAQRNSEIAAALEEVARRIRAGELHVHGHAGMTEEAAAAAALAALLAKRP